jgi:hypothetical protein
MMGIVMPTAPGEYIIRNNTITDNQVYGNYLARGGGVAIIHIHYSPDFYYDSIPAPLVYNNIIANNYAEQFGGGLVTRITLFESPDFTSVQQPVIVNNTITGNSSPKSVGIHNEFGNPILFNNIFWNDLSADNSTEIIFQGDFFKAYYNCIQNGWPGVGNINQDPNFGDNYGLDPDSHCFAAGEDSIQVGITWYYAPRSGFNGNPRPSPAGTKPDLGAIEDLTNSIRNKRLSDPGISIYPNPMTHQITVSAETGTPISQVEIIDIIGRTVRTIGNVNSDLIIIPRRDLSDGIYMFRIHTSEVYTVKVLIK